MPERTWWQKPRLRTDEPGTEPRRVTWLELFYDLVFVIVIGQLSHTLSANLSPTGLLAFAFLFVPAWWVWAAGTYYVEYWETDDLSIRVILFALILPVVGIAAFIPHALDTRGSAYAYSYAIARVVLAVLFLRVGVHSRVSRAVAWSHAGGFAVVGALVAGSALAPRGLRIGLWAAALAIEMLMPILVTRSVHRLLPHRRETSKLPERFGLFTLIVLGETVVGVFHGLATTRHVSAAVVVVGLLGLATAFGIWWIYFDGVAQRRIREGIGWEHLWGYSHLVLLMCITAVGASLAPVIDGGDTVLRAPVRWLLVGAMAVALAILGVLEFTLEPRPHRPRDARAGLLAKGGAGALALALGLWADPVNAVALLAGLLAILLLPIGFETRAWMRGRAAQPG
jgi:low temperature requirement protein LtrA